MFYWFHCYERNEKLIESDITQFQLQFTYIEYNSLKQCMQYTKLVMGKGWENNGRVPLFHPSVNDLHCTKVHLYTTHPG